MLDQAFEALKKYEWGQDPKVLKPINDALNGTRDDAAARKDLESRLTGALKGATRDGTNFICRKLRMIGTDACVSTVAPLLTQKENSHMARYALESIPTESAAKALRDSLSKVSGEQKLGVIASLGVREDAASLSALSGLLGDGDAAVARSAAIALGNIGPTAADALSKAKKTPAVVDASLSCAEDLLAAGKKIDALKIYKGLGGDDQPKHVQLAAKRGQLKCLGK